MPMRLQAVFQRVEKRVRIAAGDLWEYARDHVKTSLLTFIGAAVAIPLVSLLVPSFHLDWSHELFLAALISLMGPVVIVAAGFCVSLVRTFQDVRIENSPSPSYYGATAAVSVVGIVVAVLITYELLPGPDIEWGYGGREFGVNIGGSSDNMFIEGLSFNGKNKSGKMLHHIDGSVTILRTGQHFPLYVPIGGQWIETGQTLGIRTDGEFTIGCQMRADTLHCGDFENRMSPEQFLSDVGAFRFLFSYDGKEFSRVFSVSEIEGRVDTARRKWEQQKANNPLTATPGVVPRAK